MAIEWKIRAREFSEKSEAVRYASKANMVLYIRQYQSGYEWWQFLYILSVLMTIFVFVLRKKRTYGLSSAIA